MLRLPVSRIFSAQATERGPLRQHQRNGGGREDQVGVPRHPAATDTTGAGDGRGNPERAATGGGDAAPLVEGVPAGWGEQGEC